MYWLELMVQLSKWLSNMRVDFNCKNKIHINQPHHIVSVISSNIHAFKSIIYGHYMQKKKEIQLPTDTFHY